MLGIEFSAVKTPSMIAQQCIDESDLCHVGWSDPLEKLPQTMIPCDKKARLNDCQFSSKDALVMKEVSLAKAYDPAEVESKWYKVWEDQGYFHASATTPRPLYHRYSAAQRHRLFAHGPRDVRRARRCLCAGAACRL